MIWRRKSKAAKPRRNPLDPDRRLITNFVPPEGVPIRFDVAGLGARLIAQLADILITVAGLITIMMGLVFSDLLAGSTIIVIGSLLFFAIRVPYYSLSEILMNGQTVGKQLSGLRVISADGRTLSAHAVTVRNLLKELEVFVPGTMLLASSQLDGISALLLVIWILVLGIIPFTNANRQRLGDILAGTYVVMLPKPVLLPDLAEAPVSEAGFKFLPYQLDHYGRYELQTLEALLQVNTAGLNRAALLRHQSNLHKVAQTITNRIGYPTRVPEDQAGAFLLSFYRTQRAYLESRKLFGDTREDKFHSSRDNQPSGPS